MFDFDKAFRCGYAVKVAGIDEAGRGPLAGPVVAGAVVFSKGTYIDRIDDSKKLLPSVREELFWEIICKAEDFGIGIVGEAIIDKVNILKATKIAMQEAICDLKQLPGLLLIDAVNLPDLNIPQVAIIKGDTMSASIAAASILAKVVRDKIMDGYDFIYPMYEFKKHKGYPTKRHIEKINMYGPCEIHRKTFAPIRLIHLPYK
ncbi:MAG: ribonuclease HII [Candidatus Magnetoovum sp. WYHC-5]|nr:ribonuclease HII [Candidatus Magnetoovum sp. WYHC-5]